MTETSQAVHLLCQNPVGAQLIPGYQPPCCSCLLEGGGFSSSQVVLDSGPSTVHPVTVGEQVGQRAEEAYSKLTGISNLFCICRSSFDFFHLIFAVLIFLHDSSMNIFQFSCLKFRVLLSKDFCSGGFIFLNILEIDFPTL